MTLPLMAAWRLATLHVTQTCQPACGRYHGVRTYVQDLMRRPCRCTQSLAQLTTWNKANIRRAISTVRTDLYRRNHTPHRDNILDLLSSCIAQRWNVSPLDNSNVQLLAKILFISANPVDVVAIHSVDNAPLSRIPLGLEQELREIKRKVRASRYRDTLQLSLCPAARPTDLIQAFNEDHPHIVHFSGHGTNAGEIVLLDDLNRPQPVKQSTFESLFKVMKGEVRLVVLNACFSKPQAASITKYVDCAIGMSHEIGDEAATRFSAALYSAIGFGCSVQQAFDQAELELQLANIAEAKTPRLMARRGVNPNHVFIVPG